jgi:hypothetical protein
MPDSWKRHWIYNYGTTLGPLKPPVLPLVILQEDDIFHLSTRASKLNFAPCGLELRLALVTSHGMYNEEEYHKHFSCNITDRALRKRAAAPGYILVFGPS